MVATGGCCSVACGAVGWGCCGMAGWSCGWTGAGGGAAADADGFVSYLSRPGADEASAKALGYVRQIGSVFRQYEQTGLAGAQLEKAKDMVLSKLTLPAGLDKSVLRRAAERRRQRVNGAVHRIDRMRR